MDFPTLISTAGLVNNALSVIKSARELAKDSSDTELKEKIGAAYDALFELRERTLALDEENRKLKADLAAKDSYVGPIPPHGYYYAANDETREHPLCPSCYQSAPSKKGFLTDHQTWSGGGGRRCKLCSTLAWEEHHDSSPRVISTYDPYSGF